MSSKFGARISKPGWFRPAEGVTENISQRGIFVRTKAWHVFGVTDQAVVTILLPPNFSGHVKTVGLQGKAAVTRVDPQQGGVALQFERDLKFFERVNVV
jgi:hypothetical protein